MKTCVLLLAGSLAVLIALKFGLPYASDAYQQSEFFNAFGVELPSNMDNSQFSTLQTRVTFQLADDNRRLKMAERQDCPEDDTACIDKKVRAVAIAQKILRHDMAVATENHFVPNVPPICADGTTPSDSGESMRCEDGTLPQ